MLKFVKPDTCYFDEYLAACKESYEYGITEWMPVEPERFNAWKQYALAMYQALETGEGLPTGVPRIVTYWAIEENRFVGELQIRPYLTKDEARYMGHIGYAVRYSMWHKGYGTKILLEAISKLQELQVSPIYIACHTSNKVSQKVIQKCGFSYVETSMDGNEEQYVYVLQ